MARQSNRTEKGGNAVMSQILRRGIPVVILLLVLAAGSIYWFNADAAPKHEAVPPPPNPISVSVVTIQTETVPIVMRFLGQTEASQVVELRARVAGYLEGRSFVEGERVEAGQKLFLIDPRPFEVELAEANAMLASAEATLERARVQASRYEEAALQRATSQQEVEDWQTQARVAAAQVSLQQARIAAAQLRLGYTSIEAPITGMIGRALKDIGSYVDSGQNGLLAVIQQVDPMYIRYAVTEREILRFERQLADHEITAPSVDKIELEVTLSDGSVYPFKGRINFVDVQVDETTGTSVIRGQVPNPDNLLKPGQFIYASVLGIQRVDVVRVPQKAVSQSPTGASVLVVNDQNVAENRPVTLGEWSGADHWIIQEGLKAGDRVITDRLMMVRPGTAVSIAPAGPPSSPPPLSPPASPPSAPEPDERTSAPADERTGG